MREGGVLDNLQAWGVGGCGRQGAGCWRRSNSRSGDFPSSAPLLIATTRCRIADLMRFTARWP